MVQSNIISAVYSRFSVLFDGKSVIEKKLKSGIVQDLHVNTTGLIVVRH